MIEALLACINWGSVIVISVIQMPPEIGNYAYNELFLTTLSPILCNYEPLLRSQLLL